MSTRTPFIGGNWKMNTDRSAALELVEAIGSGLQGLGERGDVVICPPYPYLELVGRSIASYPISLGAQDVAPDASGPSQVRSRPECFWMWGPDGRSWAFRTPAWAVNRMNWSVKSSLVGCNQG